jgi:hypothetical protein
MAAHDAQVRHAKGARRLYIVQFAQLEGFGAQQPRQAGPAGNAQYGRQQKQPHVAALQPGLKHLRVFVDEHLNHQHKGRDQQHRGNRRQHGVEVLDGVVHPALEVARQDAKHQGQRNGRQRGQRANHHRRANGFESQEQHVIARLVRTHHVVVRPQRSHPAHQQRQNQQRAPYRAHGKGHHTPPKRAQRRLEADPPDARLPHHQQRARQQRHQRPTGQALQATLRHIGAPLALGCGQVLAAKLQARKVAHRHAVLQHAFFGKLVRGQRHRIGLLARLARAGQEHVEQRQGARGISGHWRSRGRSAAGSACRRGGRCRGCGRQERAEVDGIHQRDEHEQGQHHARRHRRRILDHIKPSLAQQRRA